MDDTAELERILKDTHSEEPKEEVTKDVEKEDKEKRETLIRLAEDGGLDKSVAYIKKASKKPSTNYTLSMRENE